MKEIILKVDGMVCGGCEKRIINALSDIENVEEVIASHVDNKVILKFEKDIDLELVKEKIDELDFRVIE